MVALEASKLFNGLSSVDLASLNRAAKLQSFPAGSVIFQEGDEGNGIYVVQQGQVDISALISQEQRRTLSRLGPGDFFGEMAVLDNEPRSATATAEQATTAFFIPRTDLLRMLESSPKLAVSLVREFSLKMRDFNRQYIREVLQAERLTLVGRFARSIVHDFKNPLNIIGIAAELACMESATPAMRNATKSRICKQVDRLSNMINELLEFTRGTQTSIVLAETNYASFLHQLIEDLRQEVSEKGVKLECVPAPPSVSLLLDPGRLTHVFYNLVHNSVDAMPQGGTVRLRFFVTSTEVVTEIEDTGKGIAPEIASRLFEAFATFGKAQGTGLGLSICKKIVEDHGGRIHARNEPDRGAVFSFTLPLRRG